MPRRATATYNGLHLLDGTFAPSQPDPTTVHALTNDQLASYQNLFDTPHPPTVQGEGLSQTLRFMVTNHNTGGADAQVYNAQAADPTQPVDTIQNLDQAGATPAIGPERLTRLATGANPTSIAVDPNAKVGYVTNSGSDTASVVALDENGAVNRVTGTIDMAAGARPVAAVLTPTEPLVLNQRDGVDSSTLTFVNRATSQIEKTSDVEKTDSLICASRSRDRDLRGPAICRDASPGVCSMAEASRLHPRPGGTRRRPGEG